MLIFCCSCNSWGVLGKGEIPWWENEPEGNGMYFMRAL